MKVLKLFWVTRHLNFEHKNVLQIPAVPSSSGNTVMGKQWVIFAQYIEASTSKISFVD